MNENVIFVPKRFNPLNITQTYPIKNFYGFLAQKVYEGGWEAKTEHQLIRRIKSKIKEFDSFFVESLMQGVNAKVTEIGDNGVFSLFK
jgi:hypothetical protein